MNDVEAETQVRRLKKYRELEKRRDELCAVLKQITEPWKGYGPCDQGPFTGNTRESRQVESLHIYFTATRGGSPAVEMKIHGLRIEARRFDIFLRSELQPMVDMLNSEMKEI